jgi:hypothetical protein
MERAVSIPGGMEFLWRPAGSRVPVVPRRRQPGLQRQMSWQVSHQG